VDPAAIEDIAILAIEGERDDISGIGQTKAALKISTSLPDEMKQYHFAEGRRALRHLQRKQVAGTDRTGRREVDRTARRLMPSF
jgi:hypothetical protein